MGVAATFGEAGGGGAVVGAVGVVVPAGAADVGAGAVAVGAAADVAGAGAGAGEGEGPTAGFGSRLTEISGRLPSTTSFRVMYPGMSTSNARFSPGPRSTTIEFVASSFP